MEEIVKKNKCTGCTACFSICPVKAISMIESTDGFKYPVINEEKCINCGLCKKTCPVLNTKSNYSINECYAVINKNRTLALKSSSAGVFSLISEKVLNEKGIVIGATFENNVLIHKVITKKENLDELRGSKYLQSDLGNIFDYIKKNVNEKKILFVGTPCQVAGVKRIIKNEKNLITLDIVCHGVPTPKLFKKYIGELETKYKDKLINYNFRDKSTGWDTYSNTIIFENTRFSERATDNNYMKLFLSDIALRESCYKCNFKLGNKYSDITIGDFWGIKDLYPDMYSKDGTSAIIINTEKGKEIFETIRENLNIKSCDINDITKVNKSLTFSSVKPHNRNLFFEELDKLSIDKLSKKYKKDKKLAKIKRCLKKLIHIKTKK